MEPTNRRYSVELSRDAKKDLKKFQAVYGLPDDGTVCLIVVVGPHENIYDKAERRIKCLRAAGIL